jgi:N-acetylneuraminate lyase
MKTDLAGVLPAIITPLRSDGGLNTNVFEQLIQRLYKAGVHGVYTCGQTGEGLQLPAAIRKQVTEAAVHYSPAGKMVVAQVGSNSTAEALDLARHAQKAGAHAVSSFAPLGPYSYSEIRSYYETLSEGIDIPFLAYHHPDLCPQLTADQILDLCSLPKVAGFKFTDYNLYTLAAIRQRGLIIFNGCDEVFAAGLLMGASGGIGAFYNLFPETFVQIYNLSLVSRWDDARTLQRALNPLLRDIFRFPLVPAIRAALQFSGLDTGEPVAPRRRLTNTEKLALEAILTASGPRHGLSLSVEASLEADGLAGAIPPPT